VRLPVSEAYEGLDQGIIDCAMLSAPELTNYNLHEVVTDITLAVPGGAFAGVSSANVNADRWKAMDDAGRAALLWGGSHMSADIVWNFFTDDVTALENAREKGINFHEADAELLAAVKEFSKADLDTVATLFKDTYGVERSYEIAAEFAPIFERWQGLVQDIDSADALHQLYWNEVMSKIDPATYAMQ
jgi:TRAP-type C4-dicarboxylate transport system substrate-binding protein